MSEWMSAIADRFRNHGADENVSVHKTEIIVAQYKTVARHLNDLFDALYAQTNYKEWQDRFFIGPLTEIGVGSCFLGTSDADIGIDNDALQQQRILRSQQTPGQRIPNTCLHHRKDIGCILGDLKSPFCLHFIPIPLLQEMKHTFGSEFTSTFTKTLDAGILTLKYIQNQSHPDKTDLPRAIDAICLQITGVIDQMNGKKE